MSFVASSRLQFVFEGLWQFAFFHIVVHFEWTFRDVPGIIVSNKARRVAQQWSGHDVL